MDVKQLRYFVAIAQQGSLSAAARHLHIVQPALSQALAALETELDAKLFTRSTMGVVPTTAGAELLNHALAILKQVDHARAAVKATTEEISGVVRIGILHSAAPVMCAPLFQAMRDEVPGLRPQLVVGYSDDLAQRLRRSELDLAMTVLADGERGAAESILYDEHICLVTPRGRDPSGTMVPLGRLPEFPLLLSIVQPLHRSLLALMGKRRIRLNIVGGVEDVSSLLSLCETGQLSTLLPEHLATLLSRGSSLGTRRIAHPAFLRRVAIRTNPDTMQSPAVLAAERVVKATLGKNHPAAHQPA
ncbi:HTH-type transcriptional regulator GltC [Pigmentiphaga humi]|uniref:HTH-type transcriptional regulator GltC n=1 Tax=Pigmentiphaga humi TaxID=2478468 RepID=A0A3P4B2J9_9BURK|nr:LysR substrate-binding domain-containing protein [Pigmentiphaga humi]VCU69868.1 HTH-type transcriptional regulator GltC [Pigmentiphaga humi]